MAWYDPDWWYRKPLVITGGPSGAQTDFQIGLAVAHVTDHMQTDFDDLRFTQNDGTTLIDAWLESKINGTSAEIWIKAPTTPANTVEQTYYMHYGNAAAASDWDGAATFDAFLDKSSTTGWTTSYLAVSTDGDYLKFLGDGGSSFKQACRTDWNSPSNWQLDMRYKNVHVASDDGVGVMTLDGNTSNYFSCFIAPRHTAQNQAWKYPYEQIGTDEWIEGTEFIMIVRVDESDSSTGVDYYLLDAARTQLASLTGKAFSAGSPTDMDGIWINSWGSAADIDMRLRWAFVHKYASGPPTYQFGSEESAPTEGNPFWYYNMLRRRN